MRSDETSSTNAEPFELITCSSSTRNCYKLRATSQTNQYITVLMSDSNNNLQINDFSLGLEQKFQIRPCNSPAPTKISFHINIKKKKKTVFFEF